MAHRVKLPNGTVGVFPDEMPDQEIEAVIQKQFPPEQMSDIAPTPFNGRPPPEEEETGLAGLGVDTANMFGNALNSAVNFASDAPDNVRKIGHDIAEHPVSGVGHVLGQLHAGNANLMKEIFNSPYKLTKYLIRKKLGVEVPIPFTGKSLSDLIPHIPEDTGVEKALGLEAQPERGDEFTRAVPGLVNAGMGITSLAKAGSQFLKAPSKEAMLRKALEERIAKAEEAHAATKATTEAQHNALREQFSEEHGADIGELNPTGQRVKINVKGSKQEKLAPDMNIPEKPVPEVPSEPSIKHLEEKVDAQVKASEVARKDLESTLGVKDHPTHKAGAKVQAAINGVKKTSSDLYKQGRKIFVDKKIKAANGEEIKSATEELERLNNSDELAPGYGHGSTEQRALEATIEALKGEEVAAKDVFDLQEHATSLSKKYRTKAFSGVSELEKNHYLSLADKLQTHANGLAKRLETVGGKEVQKIFKEANEGWRTYHEAKGNTVGRSALKAGEVPSDALIKIAREETGNKFMQALVKNDPELKKHLLAAHIGESLTGFENPTSIVARTMKELPEVEEKVKAFQRSLSAVKEGKVATKAEAKEIKTAHKELVDSIKQEAKQQSARQKANAEHEKLSREIKSHEEAIPKLQARIRAEGATEAEVKAAKRELEMHKKALAEKHPRMQKLKSIAGKAFKALGISHGLHKIGL